MKRLEESERRSARETPFAFYAWLLGGDGGRQRMLRRLGHEANDALDEFLELALNYERKAPASLQGFMAWLRSADTEVKRDMEISRDEVRVMTVHGAKGLEASVVIMVDTTSSPADTQRLRLIQLPRDNGGKVMVWAGKKADDPSAVATAREAMLVDTEDEYRRLLYVAMTRAADRLIVAGIKPGNAKNLRAFCWYDLADKGLAASGLQEETIETDDGALRRYTRAEDGAHVGGDAATQPGAPPALPDWLRTALPRKTIATDLLRPSMRVVTKWVATQRGASNPAKPSNSERALWNAERWHTGCCNRCPTSRPTGGATPRLVFSAAMPATGLRASMTRSPPTCFA